MTDFDIADDVRTTQLDRLSLVEDPFRASADPRYLYLGPEHLAAYRQVQAVISRRRGLALVMGNPGTGKSSLARRVYDVYSAEKNIHIAYIPRAAFESRFSGIQTVCSALASLSIPRERSYEAQLEALKSAVTLTYNMSKKNVVVIFDDAQEMSKIGLQLIHEFYNFDVNEKVIQSIVFGQTETQDLFRENHAVYARIFSFTTIPSLSLSSAMQMVMYRLRTAGRHDPLVEERAFALLYDTSLGVPRDIITLCAMATDILLERGLRIIDLDIMREAVGIYEQRRK